MKHLTALVTLTLTLASFLAVAPPASAKVPETFPDEKLITKGKLAADLGKHAEAIAAFEAVARNTFASRSLRSEAFARLGMSMRASGNHEGSVQAFQQAATMSAEDPEAFRFVVLAVGGVVPGPERWEKIWKAVSVAVERGPSGQPRASIVWPSGAAKSSAYTGEPINLDLRDADLADVLRTFSNLTKLKLVLDGEEKGTVTVRVASVPWDEALDRILQSQGLGYVVGGGVVKVVRRK